MHFNESSLISIKANTAVIFERCTDADAVVSKGDVPARIFDPLTAELKEEIKAPVDSTVFLAQSKTVAYANAVLFKLLPTE